MTNMTNKTVAEMLREVSLEQDCSIWTKLSGKRCSVFSLCDEHRADAISTLADMIEAEQAELRNQSVDVAALDLLCDKLECGDANHRATAAQIRKAMNGVPSWSSLKGVLSEDKRQLPDGIEWPRFEDGELVKMDHNFMNAIWDKNGPDSWVVTSIEFENSGRAIIRAKNVFEEDCDKIELNRGERVKRPEPEVLDADGVPIKVGDTVWYTDSSNTTEFKVQEIDAGSSIGVRIIVADDEDGVGPWTMQSCLTHRKPDTQEAIDADAAKRPCQYFGTQKCRECPQGHVDGSDVDYDECCIAQKLDLLDRQRKLMGGE